VPAANTVTCPVCELVQAPAWECAQCGTKLATPVEMDEPVQPMSGLESTQIVDPGLEVSVQADSFIEHTQIADPRQQVQVERTPDIEATGEDFGPRTAAPPGIPDACPFCGTVQPGVVVCDGCGRRKIKDARIPGTAAVVKPVDYDEIGNVRCPGCGARVKAALACSDCGSPLKRLEELF